MNRFAPAFALSLDRALYIISIASAAAVASSRSEALAISMAVRPVIMVWKFKRASSLPCEISAW